MMHSFSTAIRSLFISALFAPLLAAPARAASIPFVEVGAPAINCVFNTSCHVTVTDSVATIPVPSLVWNGTARLQTRTFLGAPGSPGANKTAYQYRVDLTQTTSDGEVPCVTDFSVDFGPITKLQYDNAGATDSVYVITTGGVGTIGLFAVTQTGNRVTFIFSQPVCAGLTPGTGKSSFFVGLTSSFIPKAVNARVSVPGLEPIDVAARAPDHPRLPVVDLPSLPLPLPPKKLDVIPK